jgi:disulfide bond formation protein DsbB
VSVHVFSTFFALLSLACWAATLGVAGLALAARRSPGAAGWLEGVADVALWAAWTVAAVTTAGSLYYSQVQHYLPCELCWATRICVYPLVVILLVAAIARDRTVWRYVVPLAAIGMVIAAYQTQLQAYPDQKGFCSLANPCSTRYVWEFGFVSLPFMALAALTFIATMMFVARWADRRAPQGEPDEPV